VSRTCACTSDGYGSPFSTDGKYHHLLVPKSGRPSTCWQSLGVIAPTATQTDALSNELSFANAQQISKIERVHSQLSILKQQ
jgi:thiamine biosynthesis lipoprotein ApbE